VAVISRHAILGTETITGREIVIGAEDAILFSPLQLQALLGWYIADRGVTLGGLPKPQGTAPPPVTIAGSSASPIGLQIEIDSTAGGTGLGQATFKWSVNNGTSYVATGVLTAAQVDIGDITVYFPVGPYNVDNKWKATISARADQSTAGNHLSQATPGFQPFCIINAVNGRPSVRWDGVDDLLQVLFTLIEPATIFACMKLLVVDGNVRSAWDGGIIQTMWTVFKDVQSSIVDSNVVPVTAPTVAAGAYHVITGIYNHASSSMRVDQSATNGSLGAASTPIGGLTVGAVQNGAFPLNFEDSEIILCAAALSTTDAVLTENYLKAKYATP
jgi:hypothetical protein